MKQQSFDDIVKKKAGSYQADVPADAWDNIVQQKKKRRFGFFWWILPLLVGSMVLLMYNKNKQVDTAKTGKYAAANNTKENSPVINEVHNSSNTTNSPANDPVHPIITDHSLQQQTETPGETATTNAVTKNNHQINATAYSTKAKEIKENSKIVIQSSAGKKSRQQNSTAIIPAGSSTKPGTKDIQVLTSNAVDGIGIKEKNIPANNISTPPDILAVNANADPQKNTITNATVSNKADSQFTAAPAPIKIAKKKNSWKAGLSINPGIAFQDNDKLLQLQRTETEPGYKKDFVANEITTTARSAIGVSFTVSKKVSKKLIVGTGIQFSVIKEKIFLAGNETTTNYSIVKRLVKDPAGDYLVDDTATSQTFGRRTLDALNSYTTWSLPLFLQTELYHNRFYTLQFSGGIYFNISRSYKNSIAGNFVPVYQQVLKQRTSQTNTGLDVFAGIRLSIPAGKKWSLYTEPSLRYSFMKNNNATILNAKYIHQAVLSFGISRSF